MAERREEADEAQEEPVTTHTVSGRGVWRTPSPLPIRSRPPGLGLGYRRVLPTLPQPIRPAGQGLGPRGGGMVVEFPSLAELSRHPGVGRGRARATPALPLPSRAPGYGRGRGGPRQFSMLPLSHAGAIGEIGPLVAKLQEMSLARQAQTTPAGPEGERGAAGGPVPRGDRPSCIFKRACLPNLRDWPCQPWELETGLEGLGPDIRIGSRGYLFFSIRSSGVGSVVCG